MGIEDPIPVAAEAYERCATRCPRAPFIDARKDIATVDKIGVFCETERWKMVLDVFGHHLWVLLVSACCEDVGRGRVGPGDGAVIVVVDRAMIMPDLRSLVMRTWERRVGAALHSVPLSCRTMWLMLAHSVEASVRNDYVMHQQSMRTAPLNHCEHDNKVFAHQGKQDCIT
jgi:hypothetical protein